MDYKKLLFDFIDRNPDPNDQEFHAFSDEKGINTHELEAAAYSLLSDFINGGKDEEEPGEYSQDQLEKGTEVEKEHTDNDLIAQRIVKDHLVENPRYYDYLEDMENKMKKEGSCSLASKAKKIKKDKLKKKVKMAGGPGSGTDQSSKKILSKFKELGKSPIISIGTRAIFMKKNKPNKINSPILVSKIKFVGQDNYMPNKLEKFYNDPSLLRIPIDIIEDRNGDYHVMDGHHRFLAALSRGRRKLHANIYKMKIGDIHGKKRSV